MATGEQVQAQPRWLPRLRAAALRRGLAGNMAFMLSLAVVLLFTFFAIWPQSVARHDPLLPSLGARNEAPGFVDASGRSYTLGTDHMGRDIFTRLIYGARVTMTVGYLGLLIGGVVGVLIGLAAGYRGGWVDRISMRVVDAQLSFPYILFAIIWAAFLGAGLFNLVLIVAIRGWVEFARVARGQALTIREREYVTAVRVLGGGDTRIVLRHILPNTMGPLLVVAGFQLGRLILLEATLSFLGLGVQPPTPSWGGMLSDARNYLSQAWWAATFPGLAISLVVLSANFMGDSLRDRFDPMLRGRF